MANLSIEPNPSPLVTIAHEDADVLVVLKPPHMVTTPGKGHEHDTLLNALFALHGPRLQNIGRERDFGLLHRLDRQTSGLLLVALTKSAYDHLRAQFEARAIRKFYWAIVQGVPDPKKGVIDRPIRESLERTGKYASKKVAGVSRAAGRHGASGPPKAAITAFRVVSEPGRAVPGRPGASVVECRPVTGRLHQIRVHMALIGHPVLGDKEYAQGPGASACPRLALHAHRLEFTHPVSGAVIDVRSEFPSDLRATLRSLALPVPRKE